MMIKSIDGEFKVETENEEDWVYERLLEVERK